MADRLKDEADLKLEALLRSDAISDNGFSDAVMSKIRRQIWVRRLALPVAFVVGGAIAVRPLSELVVALVGLLRFIPEQLGSNPELTSISQVPHVSTIAMGALLVVAALVATRLAEIR